MRMTNSWLDIAQRVLNFITTIRMQLIAYSAGA